MHSARQYTFALRLSELVTFNLLVMSKSNHDIWEHFNKQGEKVVCIKCLKSYLTSASKISYTRLCYHLKSAHGIDRPQVSEPKCKRPKKEQTLIGPQLQTLMAAEDRLSFHQIAQSNFIKDSMRKKKLIAHSSPTTIQRKVAQFHELAKADVK